MPCQYRVFPSRAAKIAAMRHCMLATKRSVYSTGFLPIYPAGHGGAHQNSGEGCAYWRLHIPINPKYVLWSCSLAILQAAPSWWRCPVEEIQGLSKYGEVWRYRLGSGSYHRNTAWQMALSCFAKCPCRAHWCGICRGGQEVTWHHCEKPPRHVPNHQQPGPYKPGTFAGSAH